MTVIVAALTKNEGIVMACDSEIMAGWQKEIWEQPKIWSTSHALMGGCGSVRAAQVVRHLVDWPENWPPIGCSAGEVERFFVREVWPKIADACFVNGSLVVDQATNIQSIEGELLVAFNDVIVQIGSDGSIGLPSAQRAAIGSGYAEALGHLGDKGPWNRNKIIEAVRRAKISAVGVGGPIYVASSLDLDVVEVVE